MWFINVVLPSAKYDPSQNGTGAEGVRSPVERMVLSGVRRPISGVLKTPKDTLICVYIDFCMPSITVNVDDDLKERMESHPEINWSEVTRQAIEEKIEALEVMDELTSESDLTESDVQEIAAKINQSGRKRVDEESA